MGLNRIRLGDLIEPCNGGNENGCYGADDVFGISVDKTFIKTKADLNGVSLSNYIVVEPKWFAFVMVTSRNGGKISIAFNDGTPPYSSLLSMLRFDLVHTEKLSF